MAGSGLERPDGASQAEGRGTHWCHGDSRIRVVGIVGLLVLGAAAASLAQAQNAPRRGRLSVTVMDQTTGILPKAAVVLEGQDQALASVRREGHTSGFGVAVFEDLEPGRYTVRAEFPGFQTTLVRDVRVRAGDNRRTITLQLEKLDEDVTVTRDKQSAAMDPRGSAFSTVLTREQIEALPDDPDEMERVLKAMAPAGRDDSGRRLQRRQAPAEVADPVDSAAAHGPVRRPEPRRHERRALHRHHDDARRRADARKHRLQLR